FRYATERVATFDFVEVIFGIGGWLLSKPKVSWVELVQLRFDPGESGGAIRPLILEPFGVFKPPALRAHTHFPKLGRPGRTVCGSKLVRELVVEALFLGIL